MEPRKKRPSASMVVAFFALAVALGGTAYAGSKITSGDIAKNAVTAKKIKNGAVKGNKIPDGALGTAKLKGGAVTSDKIADGTIATADIADSAVTGAKVANDTLNDTKLSDYELIGNSYILATATEAATEAAARTAAPEITLFTKGQARIYAKCYRDTAADTTFATIYSQTTADGAIQEGTDDFPGGNAATDFLNVATLEDNRELAEETATGNDANYDEGEWTLSFPDGTGLVGQDAVGAKNGALAGGNGLYGDGNKCLFQGSILG